MSNNQLITNAEALRLFFNEEVYLVEDSIIPHHNTVKASAEKSVETNTPTTAAPPPQAEMTTPTLETNSQQQPISFNYLGKNEKGILILVNDSLNKVSTPQGTELLRKLVLSIKLKNADFALVNYAAYQHTKFEELRSFFSCRLVFSFGVEAPLLGLAPQKPHQLNIVDDIKMVFTHNLHDLETDIAAKKLLWSSLKTLSI